MCNLQGPGLSEYSLSTTTQPPSGGRQHANSVVGATNPPRHSSSFHKRASSTSLLAITTQPPSGGWQHANSVVGATNPRRYSSSFHRRARSTSLLEKPAPPAPGKEPSTQLKHILFGLSYSDCIPRQVLGSFGENCVQGYTVGPQSTQKPKKLWMTTYRRWKDTPTPENRQQAHNEVVTYLNAKLAKHRLRPRRLNKEKYGQALKVLQELSKADLLQRVSEDVLSIGQYPHVAHDMLATAQKIQCPENIEFLIKASTLRKQIQSGASMAKIHEGWLNICDEFLKEEKNAFVPGTCTKLNVSSKLATRARGLIGNIHAESKEDDGTSENDEQAFKTEALVLLTEMARNAWDMYSSAEKLYNRFTP